MLGIQYQMNGILLPLDMNTDPTFTQLLNSYFVQSVSLIDGVLPAQYGYRTSGVIDIHTKNGCEGGHNNLTYPDGQRDTAQAEFPARRMQPRLSYYLTGTFTTIESRLKFRGPGARSDSRRSHTRAGIRLSHLRAGSGDETQPDHRNDARVSINFPTSQICLPQYQLEDVDPAAYPSSAINSGLNQQDYYGVLALNGAWGRTGIISWRIRSITIPRAFTQTRLAISSIRASLRTFSPAISRTRFQGDLTYRLGSAHTLRGGFYLGEYGVETDQTSQVFPIVRRVTGESTDLRHGELEQDQFHLWRLFPGHLANHQTAERQFRLALGPSQWFHQ